MNMKRYRPLYFAQGKASWQWAHGNSVDNCVYLQRMADRTHKLLMRKQTLAESGYRAGKQTGFPKYYGTVDCGRWKAFSSIQASWARGESNLQVTKRQIHRVQASWPQTD